MIKNEKKMDQWKCTALKSYGLPLGNSDHLTKVKF